jgi:hypothetical protein
VQLSATRRNWLEKIGIGLGLVALSALLYGLDVIFWGDWETIKKYVAYHVPILPIHALVLGIIIEEMLTWREKRDQRRKLNLFLGIFFRQMGVDFYVAMIQLVKNRDELDSCIIVGPQWKAADFRRARQALGELELSMDPDPAKLADVFRILGDREREIMDMTRNPNLWEFEELYRTLVALFHLIEESRFRGREDQLSLGVRRHLARDVGKGLTMLLGLWLHYLEFLKRDHPVLFSFQAGVHNTVQPLMLEDEWEE